jgi:hypothetical protein
LLGDLEIGVNGKLQKNISGVPGNTRTEGGIVITYDSSLADGLSDSLFGVPGIIGFELE